MSVLNTVIRSGGRGAGSRPLDTRIRVRSSGMTVASFFAFCSTDLSSLRYAPKLCAMNSCSVGNAVSHLLCYCFFIHDLFSWQGIREEVARTQHSDWPEVM